MIVIFHSTMESTQSTKLFKVEHYLKRKSNVNNQQPSTSSKSTTEYMEEKYIPEFHKRLEWRPLC